MQTLQLVVAAVLGIQQPAIPPPPHRDVLPSVALDGLQALQGFAGLEGLEGLAGLAGLEGLGGVQGLEGVQGLGGFEGLAGFEGVATVDAFGGFDGAAPSPLPDAEDPTGPLWRGGGAGAGAAPP